MDTYSFFTLLKSAANIFFVKVLSENYDFNTKLIKIILCNINRAAYNYCEQKSHFNGNNELRID